MQHKDVLNLQKLISELWCMAKNETLAIQVDHSLADRWIPASECATLWIQR